MPQHTHLRNSYQYELLYREIVNEKNPNYRKLPLYLIVRNAFKFGVRYKKIVKKISYMRDP